MTLESLGGWSRACRDRSYYYPSRSNDKFSNRPLEVQGSNGWDGYFIYKWIKRWELCGQYTHLWDVPEYKFWIFGRRSEYLTVPVQSQYSSFWYHKVTYLRKKMCSADLYNCQFEKVQSRALCRMHRCKYKMVYWNSGELDVFDERRQFKFFENRFCFVLWMSRKCLYKWVVRGGVG